MGCNFELAVVKETLPFDEKQNSNWWALYLKPISDQLNKWHLSSLLFVDTTQLIAAASNSKNVLFSIDSSINKEKKRKNS